MKAIAEVDRLLGAAGGQSAGLGGCETELEVEFEEVARAAEVEPGKGRGTPSIGQSLQLSPRG